MNTAPRDLRYRRWTAHRSVCAFSLVLTTCAAVFSDPEEAVASAASDGAYRVAVEYVTWHDPARHRDIPAKIFAPERGQTEGLLPVVLFSHGLGESRDSFDYLGRYWASHGYLSVFLTHAGSDRASLKSEGLPRGDTARGFDPRPVDLRFAADKISAPDTGSRLLGGRVDVDRMGIAGQCAGSTSALYMVGLTLEKTDGTLRNGADPRFKVAVALGPQMPIRMFAPRYWASSARLEGGSSDLHARSWEQIRVPTLVVTGTEDYSYFPVVRQNPSLLRMSYDGMPAGDRYLSEILGAEHHAFTDSEPWYAAGPRHPRHHDLIGATTTQFLDAFLKGRREAIADLQAKTLTRTTGGAVRQEDKTGAPAVSVGRDAVERRSSGSTMAAVDDQQERFRRLFARLDADASGRVERAEISPDMPRLNRGFDRIDEDGDGVLSEQEFVGTLVKYGRGGHVRSAVPPVSQTPRAAASPIELDRGPHRVETLEDVTLRVPGRDGDLRVRVAYPVAEAKFPVIVVSHYWGGGNDAYDEITRFWASHGYVCLVPDHGDSAAVDGRRNSVMAAAIPERMRDISFVLDAIPELAGEHPILTNRIDTGHIGIMGHYLGAMAANLHSGVRWYPPGGGDPLSVTEPRVAAVVLISPTGLGQGLTEDSWAHVSIPSMTITGTYDDSRRTGKPAEWRADGYRFSPPGDRYLVYIQDYRSVGRPEEPGSMTFHAAIGETSASYVYAVTLDFWDAYLKDADAARDSLVSTRWSAETDNMIVISHR